MKMHFSFYRMGAVVALGALLVAAWVAPALAQDGRARLEQELTAKLKAFPGFERLPEADRGRGLKCIVDSFMADIPEEDAGRLVDMIEKKIPVDQALVMRWLVIEKGDNPERHAQVKARSAEFCPDLMKVLDGG
jgi:hypothetical protein